MGNYSVEEYLKITLKPYVLFHPKFFEDFSDLVSRGKDSAEVCKKILEKIFAIKNLGDIKCGVKWLEELKYEDNMYSLHIKSKTYNYRILLSVTDDKKIFLHMFYERDGKRSTGYGPHIQIAKKRKEEYGGNINEQ